MLHLTRVTLATTDMEAMVNFYNGVFNTQLQAKLPFYEGKLADVELLMCPNSLAQVDARQNRQQFRFVVDNLEGILQRVQQYGGKVKDRATDQTGTQIAGVVDPDGNTIELLQHSPG